MNELILSRIIDELVAGTSTIIEHVFYTEYSAEKVYFVKRNWHPENPTVKIPEPADKCAQELRHLVGTGKFTVNIDDMTWERMIREGSAQFREFSVS